MRQYIAVIGDLIKSRQIEERGQVQKRLEAVLHEINYDERYRASLQAKFTITIGDEFQGIFHSARHLLEILTKIELAMHPHSIRFGLGVGSILTEIGDYSIGADGPAFWQARAAIDYIHVENDFSYANIYIMRADEAEADADADAETDLLLPLMNTLLSLRSFIQKKWTEGQSEVVTALIETQSFHEDFVRKDIAEHMGITASALVKRVKAAGLLPYLRSAQEVEALLQSYLEIEH